MELLFRLHDGTGPPSDLHLEVAEDLTVGELADELAHRAGGPPGLTIAQRWPREAALVLQRDDLVSAVGPRRGASIELVPTREPGPSKRPGAPVVLIDPVGARRRVEYGWTELGPIRLHVSDHVSVHTTRTGADAMLNGQRLLGSSRVAHGDLIGVAGSIWRVRIDDALRPPAPRGPSIPHGITAPRRPAHRPATVELPTPPGATRLPGFPVLSACVPLLMGAALWFATRSVMSVAFVAFSFVFVVASGLEARREARAERRFRLEEFDAELDRVLEQVERRRVEQIEHAHRRAPGALESIHRTEDERRELWQSDGAELWVQLGTGRIPSDTTVRVPDGGDRRCRDRLRVLAELAAELVGPVQLDLRTCGGLALIGTDELTTELARSIVVQLTTAVAPGRLSLTVLCGPGRSPSWRWCTWLPHGRAPRSDVELVVAEGVRPEVVREHLANAERPCALVWISSTEAAAPTSAAAVLRSPGRRAAATLCTEHDELGWVDVELDAVDSLGEDDAELAARRLCAVDPVDLDRGASRLERASVRLGDVLADPALVTEPDAVLTRWGSSAGASLVAPVGRTEHGVVQIDLHADGPHALVAGTTGSGKSELLRSLVVSLALHHPPERVSFLLIDYKGGAAFRSVEQLPHTVGMITDLSGRLASRALMSLGAELRRREHVLAAHGASDLGELAELAEPDVVPAALIVVVDEFATLTRELPDFVDGLVDVAQRGRSLGIHLVLATQRPAGVVSDAIRANTTLRVALRMADAEDSRDVVDRPDAAAIERDRPGRAVLRVGPGQLVEVQTAFSGGCAAAPARVRDVGITEQTPTALPSAGPTELEQAVDTVRRACARRDVALPPRPWLDPLGEVVSWQELAEHDLAERGPAPGRYAVGLLDEPAAQRRGLLRLDLARDGGLLVCGASGSGRTTTLRALACSMRDGAEAVRIHLIGATTPPDGDEPHSDPYDDVVALHDGERVLRLLRRVADELSRGRDDQHPRRFLALDGFAAFEELHERINRGEALDLLGRIAREGRAQRVHVVVSAARAVEVPAALRVNLACVVQLRCAGEDDAAMAGVPPSAADPALPPGRAIVAGLDAQIALPAVGQHRAPATPELVGRLPRRLTLDALLHRTGTSDAGPLEPLLGLHADDLEPVRLDLRHHHGVVAGPPRSGCSTTLATLAAAFEHAALVHARPDPVAPEQYGLRHGLHDRAPDDRDLEGLQHLVRQCMARAEDAVVLLAVDDLPELLCDPRGAELERLLLEAIEVGRRRPLRVVVAGEVDAMLRSYGDLLTRLRSGRTGVLLGDDPESHGTLLHASLARRDELERCAGRGWLLGPASAAMVQVAVGGAAAQAA